MRQSSIDDFIKKHTHAGGSDTEHDAADSQVGSLAESCTKVLNAIGRSFNGLTDEEGTEITGIYSYRRRRSDLKNSGLVVDSGLRRNNARGKAMIVWVVR